MMFGIGGDDLKPYALEIKENRHWVSRSPGDEQKIVMGFDDQ